MSQDFVDLLRCFTAADVRFLVVGAYAVGLHARPRATGDLDLWIEPAPANATRVMAALRAFGAPLAQLDECDLGRPDMVVQIGVPPRRIDLLTSLTGVEFAAAWPRRVRSAIGGVACDFIGRDDLVANKRALGRPRDLADLEDLGHGGA
jgi:hypothetical protein